MQTGYVISSPQQAFNLILDSVLRKKFEVIFTNDKKGFLIAEKKKSLFKEKQVLEVTVSQSAENTTCIQVILNNNKHQVSKPITADEKEEKALLDNILFLF